MTCQARGLRSEPTFLTGENGPDGAPAASLLLSPVPKPRAGLERIRSGRGKALRVPALLLSGLRRVCGVCGKGRGDLFPEQKRNSGIHGEDFCERRYFPSPFVKREKMSFGRCFVFERGTWMGRRAGRKAGCTRSPGAPCPLRGAPRTPGRAGTVRGFETRGSRGAFPADPRARNVMS